MPTNASPPASRPVVAPGVDTPVERLAGVGPRQSTRLAKLGIHTVRDLLLHLPRRHADTSRVLPLAELRPGPEVQTVHGTVRRVSQRRSPRKRMSLVEAVLDDEGSTATATAVWFNQPFLVKSIHAGDDLVLSGKVRLDQRGLSLQNPTFEKVVAGNAMKHVGRSLSTA